MEVGRQSPAHEKDPLTSHPPTRHWRATSGGRRKRNVAFRRKAASLRAARPRPIRAAGKAPVHLIESAGFDGVRMIKFDAKRCSQRDGVAMREQQLEGFKAAN
jgi:hypothetical protein